VLAVSACASGPAYQPAASATATGYSEQRIENDRWRVRYTGTSRMSSAQVQDYALMRAAEVTLANGGQWFEVVNADTDKDLRHRSSIETDFGTDYVLTRQCGVLGCTTRAVPVIVRAERETIETRTVYEHVLEIITGTGVKRAGSDRVYDARDTFQNLQARLG
jgi:hypothetical protein